MQSSAPELTIGRSMSGRCQVEGPRSDAAVRAQLTCDPVDNVRAFHLVAYLVLRTVRAVNVRTDPGFAMVESASSMQWKPLGSCSLTSADLIGAMPKLVQPAAIDSSLRTLSANK